MNIFRARGDISRISKSLGLGAPIAGNYFFAENKWIFIVCSFFVYSESCRLRSASEQNKNNHRLSSRLNICKIPPFLWLLILSQFSSRAQNSCFLWRRSQLSFFLHNMLMKGLLLLANLEIRLLLLIWALHHIGNCFQEGLWCVDLAQKAVLSGVKGNGSVPLIFQLSCLFCPLEPQHKNHSLYLLCQVLWIFRILTTVDKRLWDGTHHWLSVGMIANKSAYY